jgi:DNA adenine methylase
LTNGFIKYNSKLFRHSDELRLARVAQELAKSGASVIVSNAAHPLIKQMYDGPFYKIELRRPSLIAADPARRTKFSELLITTFPLSLP